MIKLYPFILTLLCSLNVSASGNSFMEDFFPLLEGSLINVMSPCDPGCYAEIKINEDTISSPTSGIYWEELYKLEEDKNNKITLMYSISEGPYVIHENSKKKFKLVGSMEKHPIDYALENCYSSPRGQSTIGINSCLIGAEMVWDAELNRVYSDLGGSNNIELKNTQLAWIKFRDAQFTWFNKAILHKQGSKWSYGVRERRVNLIRQQVERLQSFYKGY
jgi:uncharacterized protein YecT (DUF1311 family)